MAPTTAEMPAAAEVAPTATEMMAAEMAAAMKMPSTSVATSTVAAAMTTAAMATAATLRNSIPRGRQRSRKNKDGNSNLEF